MPMSPGCKPMSTELSDTPQVSPTSSSQWELSVSTWGSWMKRDDSAQGFMWPQRQKVLFGAFSSLGHFTFVFQPSSCLSQLNSSLPFLSGCGIPICRSVVQQSSLRNHFHLPLVLNQNAKSKCASISIANVQGNGVEIICSLKKKLEEILFSAPCALQNISPLTDSCRSCAELFGVPKVCPRCLGCIRGGVAWVTLPGASSTACACPGDADPESAAATTLKPFPVHQGPHHLFSHLQFPSPKASAP